jgi:FlaA1/EpsC-like NDP-sugar epimerase
MYIYNYTEKFASKWLVLSIDVSIAVISFLIATLVRFNFDLVFIDFNIFRYQLLFVLVIRVFSFFLFGTYQGIVRHTSVEDTGLIFKSISLSTFTLLCLANFNFLSSFVYFDIPNSILVIDFFIVLVLLIFSRLLVKSVYKSILNNSKVERKVLIYGAGQLGRTTKDALLRDEKLNHQIIGFIDDDTNKIGKAIEGTKVYSAKEAISRFISNNSKVQPVNVQVILAIQRISPSKRSELVDYFLNIGLLVKSIPPVSNWIKGKFEASQIQDINIEDLLERESIKLNNRLVSSFVNSKVIMVTGAAGSIGSELVRQILLFKPSGLILIDQAESALYELETELLRLSKINDSNLHFEVGDVVDKVEMKKHFETYKPEVIFHAAAYKHVPLMEKSPLKAVKVNFFGTKTMADLANSFKTERFVLISTDKAVNPTNVMGASKRLAEIYIQSLNSYIGNQTRFITTRFGNVLGSNGSVIPLFKRQIAAGGPVTVTHPKIIRYFMTIPEACQLVLEAGTMGNGGEVFVFEMGEPVKILDLAKRMIQLSGFKPDVNMKIEFTGLRPGEKLYEELLGGEESTLPTHHSKILIAKVKLYDFKDLNLKINEIHKRYDFLSSEEIVHFLKSQIPEFISKNSIYEKLDIK